MNQKITQFEYVELHRAIVRVSSIEDGKEVILEGVLTEVTK